jgi:hypothetical protein
MILNQNLCFFFFKSIAPARLVIIKPIIKNIAPNPYKYMYGNQVCEKGGIIIPLISNNLIPKYKVYDLELHNKI